MSQTDNGPTGGMPSHDSQRTLVTRPSSNLDGRHTKAKPGQRTKLQQAITIRFVLLAMRQWWKVATPIGLLLAADIVDRPVDMRVRVFQSDRITKFLRGDDRDHRDQAVAGPLQGRPG